MGGWRRIAEYSGQDRINHMCPLVLDNGPDALQLIGYCFTEVRVPCDL